MLRKLLSIIALLAFAGAYASEEENQGGEASCSPNQEKRLDLRVDAVAFLENDDYVSPLVKGYTVPGFRFSPTLLYQHGPHASIEGGFYMLHYWGAQNYPRSSYWGVPQYDDKDKSSFGHFLPFLRVKFSTDFGLDIVLGNLYGGMAHGLIEPMYFPELALTADPEAGIQAIYRQRWVDADAWVDWRTFIYHDSPYRENFLFGLSAALKPTAPGSAWQVSVPVQMLVEHYGGEIDITEPGIETLINAAAGVRAEYRFQGMALRSVGAEAMGLVSKQVAGSLWGAYDKGAAFWSNAWVNIVGIKLSAGYFKANKYVSIAGCPVYSTISLTDGAHMQKPGTFVAALEYEYQFAKGFSLSAGGKIYNIGSCALQDGGQSKSGTSFCFGATAHVEIGQKLWSK